MPMPMRIRLAGDLLPCSDQEGFSIQPTPGPASILNRTQVLNKADSSNRLISRTQHLIPNYP